MVACNGAHPTTPMRVRFGRDVRPANPTCVAPPRPPPTTAARFERVFANVKLANAVVLLDSGTGPTEYRENVSVALPSTQRFTFSVRRAAPGAAVTVPMVVYDECGAWETFVGAGAAVP